MKYFQNISHKISVPKNEKRLYNLALNLCSLILTALGGKSQSCEVCRAPNPHYSGALGSQALTPAAGGGQAMSTHLVAPNDIHKR